MALSHTSGVQREPPGEIWETMKPPSREELLAGLEDVEQVLRPGERWHYSNLVFALLGEVVMRVSGERYRDVLQQRILDPLGLTRTSLHPEPPKASPYFVDPYSDAVHLDTWRVVDGKERGELLRAVRDESGAVTKLYFVTYPLTREPATFI